MTNWNLSFQQRNRNLPFDMLIVITSPDKIDNEGELLNQLFVEGLECLHLRKPSWTKQEYESLLKSINSEYKRRVVLHQHHEFASKYNIKGLHLREENRLQISLTELEELKKQLKRNNLTISSSFHSQEEIEKYENVFDYVFLSPVFDSISKQGYLRNDEFGVVNDEWKSKIKSKIIALGGIDASNIHKTKELGFDGSAVLGAIWQESRLVIENYKNLHKLFINSNI